MTTRTTIRPARRRVTTALRVLVTNAAYGELCRDSLRKLPRRDREQLDLRVFPDAEKLTWPRTAAAITVAVSRLADWSRPIAGHALKTSGVAKHLVFLEDLPVEALPARLLQLDIRNPHRLHVAAERGSLEIVELLSRLFSGLLRTGGPPSIVDAWLEGEQLVLLAPTFERLSVPLHDLARLIGPHRADLEAFEIDEDGRDLHWPRRDVHLGWEQLLQIVDPLAALAAQQRSREFHRQYGEVIREFRESQGLKQADIPGLTDRHLRRVERGELAATKSTLESLARAHGLSFAEYLQALAKRL